MVSWSIVALGLSLSTSLWSPDAVRYDGHKVVRIDASDHEALRVLLEIADDVWSERIGPGPVDARVPAEKLALLDASGIDYDVRVADVQVAVDLEAQRLQAAAPPQAAAVFFDDFRDHASVDGHLDTLHADAPSITEVLTVGQSLEGRTIRGIKIGTPGAGKAAVIFTGTMHAREWLSTMVTTCIADRYVHGYDVDPQVTEVLDTIDVYVIPIINPDGYVYSWQSDRYWRKNRRGGHGVDLNRNWGHGWGGAGASTNPYDETYRGSGPFSEPETQVVSDFLAARSELVAHIDFHSYAELIIYPWGCCYEAAPDENELASMAETLSGAIQGVHGRYYQPIQGADFYPAAGAVDDWSYGDQDLRAFTIELRGNDFVISPSAIEPTCDENFAATLQLAEWAMQFSDVDPGPGSGTDGAGTSGPDGHTTGPVPPDTGGTSSPPSTATSGGDETGPGWDDTGGGKDPQTTSNPTCTDQGAAHTVCPDPSALPPGFGDRPTHGCACTTSSSANQPGWLALWLLVLMAPNRGCWARGSRGDDRARARRVRE